MNLAEVMAADQVGFPLLSVLIALPLVVCAVLQFVRGAAAAKALAIGGASLQVLLAG